MPTKKSEDCSDANIWLTVKKLAVRFDTHPSTIYRWVQQNRFTRPVKLGDNLTRWSLKDIET